MTDRADIIVDEAIAWHLRLSDADAEQWRGFVDWLEADEAHRLAYDQVVMDDALIAPSLKLDDVPVAANDAGSSRRAWRWPLLGSGAVAAAMAAAMLMSPQTPATYSIETAPGVKRLVKLDDGTTIEMNGGSRMTFRRGDARYAALDAGEAAFHVRHDADHPFELQAGSHAIRDLGTMFNVSREGGTLDVQVAEGSVAFDPERQNVTLTPGMALTAHDDRAGTRLRRLPVETVGGWRQGVLNFRMASLASVGQAVTRSTGARVTIDPALADRRFTGTIHLTGGHEKVIPHIAALVDASWRHDEDGWALTAKKDEGR